MWYTPVPRRLQSFALAALLVGALTVPFARAATAPPLRAPHAAVASDHAAASAAGVELLKGGGNAVDAACATAAALGVVTPHSSGIGGGGFAVVYIAKEKKVYTLDFRERAPAAIKPEMFIRNGRPDSKLSTRSGLAAGVPGEVRGLAHMLKKWGKLPFAACFAPAERLARGTPATYAIADVINGTVRRSADGFIQKVFTLDRPFALPVRPGEMLRRPALADTLAKLRKEGPDAFYAGPIAEAIIAAGRAAGGVMDAADLRAYAAVERPPLTMTYRGHKIFSMPPPSSGGIVIAEALGILEAKLKDPPRGSGRFSSSYLHVLAEAQKHGFADRARHLGDPDFVKVPVDKLLDPAYHKALAARIKDDGVLPADQYGMPGAATAKNDGGTTSLSVMDAEGNAVALTTTVNLYFGAQIVAGPTGIVLNNQMDDFSMAPDTPNAFGLIGKDKNLVAPNKRPLSSMSPTIVLDGDKAWVAVGGAGGPTIISGTLQVLLNIVDGKLDAQEASASPRIHHQWSPETLSIENDLPADVTEGLTRRGHKLRVVDHLTKVNVVVRTSEGIEAAAEYRGGGTPAGY